MYRLSHMFTRASHTLFVLDTPSAWEVIKRQAVNLLHWNFTTAGYSAGCAFRLQKYHYPSPRSSPSTECNSVSSEVSLNRSLRFQGRSWRAFRCCSVRAPVYQSDHRSDRRRGNRGRCRSPIDPLAGNCGANLHCRRYCSCTLPSQNS